MPWPKGRPAYNRGKKRSKASRQKQSDAYKDPEFNQRFRSMRSRVAKGEAEN